jgi:hypothetical protein
LKDLIGRARGVIVNITKQLMDEALSILEDALTEAEAEL